MKRTAPIVAAIAALGIGVFWSTPAAAAWTRNASGTTPASKATSVGIPGAGSTSSPTTSSLVVTWSAPGGGAHVGGYEVLRGGTLITAGGCSSTTTRATTAVTCTDNNGLSAGTNYQYTVRAILGNWVGVTNTQFAGTTSSAPSMHISAISATASQQNANKFHSVVTVTVVDGAGAALVGVTVTGAWSPTASAASNCAAITTAAGQCTITTGNSDFDTATTQTWTVSNLTKAGSTWNSVADVDKAVTVTCPSAGACTIS